MDPAVAGALIGVVGTAAATLGSQALTIARDRQREKAEVARELARERAARRDETRKYIDGSPYQLRTMLNQLDGLIMLFAQLEYGGVPDTSPLHEVAMFRHSSMSAFELESSLSVRLPQSHPLLVELRTGADALDKINTALATLVGPAMAEVEAGHATPASAVDRLVDNLRSLRGPLAASLAAVTAAARDALAESND